MHRQLFLYLYILLVGTMANTAAQSLESVTTTLQELRSRFAPDRRTELFDVAALAENGKILLAGETSSASALTELNSRLTQLGIVASDNAVQLLPRSGTPPFAVITVSVANHRTEPKHSAEMATQSLLGTLVQVLKKEADFSLVRTPDRYIAWVDNEALWFTDETGANEWLDDERVIITKPFLFLLASKNDAAPPVADLILGNILRLSAKEGEWWQVALPDGRSGYIPAGSADDFRAWALNRSASVENILKSGFSFTGIPYLWGGTSVKGLDCSGFTKTCFFLNGLIIPRDASQQVREGEPVGGFREFDALLPGDLLFFGEKDSVREKVTHVGIYIGNGEFIHETGKVRVNSFNPSAPNYSKHRFKQYLRAKRFINVPPSAGILEVRYSPNYFRQVPK